MIKLTYEASKKPVWVQPKAITVVDGYKDYTAVTLTSGDLISVTETPEEIIAKIGPK